MRLFVQKISIIMKTICISFAIMLVALASNADPYRSIFGTSSTSWKFRWGNLFGITVDSAYYQKDTIVNNITYKKVVTKSGTNIYEGGLFREDLPTGKVWYRDIGYKITLNPADTLERLAFDFSLTPGDTFTIDNCTFTGVDTVDSVKVIDGLKHIYFKSKLHTGEPYTLIEGIGSNLGVLCKNYPSLMVGQYLLCSYKDGFQTPFRNKEYNGACDIPVSVHEVDPTQDAITVSPNPATSSFCILGGVLVSKVQIVTADGRFVKEIVSPGQAKISTEGMALGQYFLHLYLGDGKIVNKHLLIK